MLGIQLTALSAAEVKRLLELARARGQDSLARQLEAELAARPGRTPGQTLPMSATPRPAPRYLAPPPIRPRRAPAVAVAGLAAFIGAALAWGVSLSPPQTQRPQAVALTTGQPAPRIAVALTTTKLPEESLTQPIAEPSAPALRAELPPERRHDNPCLDLPTAHERLVCGYPSLAIQDRRMKSALEQARADGADPKALEDAQSAWQAGSANIQDRLALADRYARRIAELQAE
ncbi:MAG: hypothetical protein KKE02_05825 [Alphaproteobacteria bacterium]|nr:hypothetical protein [Alphaproteobacteria bacterium]MBU1512924.1 hypothetical protein [Alphaproteobacteria bacterium]MBU2096635.1 hypothetical protein [Alphaproteobacteria bacterium]MBU2150518.1 hypothetical protein [Alphaproteobacteria bacterium]MBU2306553.1 hypothetical protein [Alphaproteobacteria bacterium]